MRKKDVVHQAVLDRLISRKYRFGDAVSVGELAELCGVSRQPIMTALSTLAADGFLTVTAQVGCSVVSPSLQEIGDFFLMFGRFEGLLSELAAQRGTKRAIADIAAINRRIATLDLADPRAGERYRLLNREFHVAIHAMAEAPCNSGSQRCSICRISTLCRHADSAATSPAPRPNTTASLPPCASGIRKPRCARRNPISPRCGPQFCRRRQNRCAGGRSRRKSEANVTRAWNQAARVRPPWTLLRRPGALPMGMNVSKKF